MPLTSFGKLTCREWCVIKMLAREMTPQQIAAKLFISNKTVSQHINNIEAKLGVENRLFLHKKLIAIKLDIHPLSVTTDTVLFQ
ncbi:helix-turn-helix domain-containing protein [Rouxiella sp. Mn2063]|uniref:helix-turn-helix domain-containing protein n=1 Tax=Rouxiella sp. Mn2063 TaxID=3395262 RepID=UPI003BE32388